MLNAYLEILERLRTESSEKNGDYCRDVAVQRLYKYWGNVSTNIGATSLQILGQRLYK
jgi:hypothetical protein